ncbi:MAG: FAD-dependent oxidoreductase [Dehalococcoidales bacterium]|nr:FAD-dependent oxidoreductase [Dehalococcoidales bacterium]
MEKTDPRFKELFKPGRIGKLELKNRIVMAPMGTYLGGRDGLVPDRMKRYYAERARGGVGLVIVEVASVDHPRGKVMTRQIGISDDKFLAGLTELVETVHKNGAAAGIQLQHGGRIAVPFLSGGHEPVSASVVPLVPKELGVTRELSVCEISGLVECFARAAVRARTAGFDGVEIHAGHGYLIDQFLSRSTNKRTDEYGGSLHNRARFLLEIIMETRRAAGNDFPVWCRIDGREFAIEDGITAEEAREIAGMIEKAGVDAVNLSGYGGSMGVHFTEAPIVSSPGFLLPLAQAMKKSVKIPVITAGRISPELAEKTLRDGDADFIAMGRPLLADPDLPRKLAEGKMEDIRKCIYCYTCVHQIFVRNNVCCAINPSVGKENEPTHGPPEKQKLVLVVGGGPAGMEAAITAASRGHRVILCEKENRLGGSLVFASIVRRENEDLVDYLIKRVNKLNIEVKLGQTVTGELVRQLKPEALILATGSIRQEPAVAGIGGRMAINGDDLRQMLSGHLNRERSGKLTGWERLLLGAGTTMFKPFLNPGFIRRISRLWMPLGKRIVILGAGMVGCELAVFLAERGRKVTIIEETEQIAPEMPLPFKWIILDRLEKYGADIITGVKYQEICTRGVKIEAKNNEQRMVEADKVIVATGTTPDEKISAVFEGKAPEVFLVGDCNKLSFIKDSIADARKTASMI